MNAPESTISTSGFEICPGCSQRTASEYFRTVNETRICNLCAQRAEEDTAMIRARIEDEKYHGGMGWLWKYLAGVAAATVAYVVVRYLVRSWLLSQMN